MTMDPPAPPPPGKAVGAGPVASTGAWGTLRPRPLPPPLSRPILESAFSFHRYQRRIERRRLTHALLFSLLAHALLSRVHLGGEGWVRDFGFPWQDRRPDLHVALVPAEVVAPEPTPAPVPEPVPPPQIVPPPAPPVAPPVPRVPPSRGATAVIVPEAERKDATPDPPAAVQLPSRADVPSDVAITPSAAPPGVALMHIDKSTWVVPPQAVSTPTLEPSEPVVQRHTALANIASLEAERQAIKRAEPPRVEAPRVEAQRALPAPPKIQTPVLETAEPVRQRQDTALADIASLEAERQATRAEAARVEAERVEAARAEAARVEAARVETARIEAAKLEAARVAAAKLEAERLAAVRAEAAKKEAERLAIAQEAAKREETLRRIGRQLEEEAERRDVAAAVARQAPLTPTPSRSSPRPDTAPVGTAQDPSGREALLRAIGRDLDEEARQRDVAAAQSREAAAAAARQPPSLATSYTSLRRYRLYGRSDPNAVIMLYAETWSRKIELNMTYEMVRDVAKTPHTHPQVTVAIRSDGSVESVTFVVPSGVAAVDEAIRRVVQSQAPYQAFPPSLANEYDVLEIRRTWYFDSAIRLN